MFESTPKEPQQGRLRFGGGVNSRASADEIDPRECSAGYNFDLDVENTNFRPRKPFSLWLERPSAYDDDYIPVGYIENRQDDGSVNVIIQYSNGSNSNLWQTAYNSGGSLASGTIASTPFVGKDSRVRGPLSAQDRISGNTVATDLNGNEVVCTWGGNVGSAPGKMAHNLGGGTDEFYAKYAFVAGERMWYGNIISGPTGTLVETPHMIVGSAIEDYDNLSVSTKAGAATGAADPFYLLTPDLRPINGIIGAFGQTVFSSEYGSVFVLSGLDATDFTIDGLFDGSAATGQEGFVFAGNDIVYSRPGYIESLAGVQAFGDVENDDLTRAIKNDVKGFEKFTLVWDSVGKRLFVFPENSDTLWVFHKTFYDQRAKDVALLRSGSELSPWVPWISGHPEAFNVDNVWSMIDPVTGLPGVFFGGSDGNLYKIDGGDYGDSDGGGTLHPVRASRTSVIVSASSGDYNNMSGWIKYTEQSDDTITGVINVGGSRVGDHEFRVTMSPNTYNNYFGDADAHFGGEQEYFNLVESKRQKKKPFSVSSIGSMFQIHLVTDGDGEFEVSEVGIEFTG